MKKTNLLKLALCAMTLLPTAAWADEVSVSTEKTWTFDDLTATTQYSTYTEMDGLYLRTNQTGRSFTVTAGSAEHITFADGYQKEVTNYLYVNNNATYSGSDALTATSTAGDGTSTGRGMVAINATVAGTFYAKIKGNTAGKVIRMYFADGSSIKNTSVTSDGEIQEISYTSTAAGSFFVGGITTGTSCIYAVRFVPTADKPKDIVYIGATGYATYGNVTGKHLVKPEGLTVYNATAKSTYVALTSVTGIRMGKAFVLQGTPNTSYSLKVTDTDPGTDCSGGDMVRASDDMADFAATEGTGNDLRYRYLLGNDGGVAKFFVPSGSGTLKKGRAYLKTKNALTTSFAHGIDMVVEDETTSLREKGIVKREESATAQLFDLQGRRVAQPTKGLYIVNGKKVIIK